MSRAVSILEVTVLPGVCDTWNSEVRTRCIRSQSCEQEKNRRWTLGYVSLKHVSFALVYMKCAVLDLYAHRCCGRAYVCLKAGKLRYFSTPSEGDIL